MQDNQTLSKAELIQKLEEISSVVKGVAEINQKIKNFQPSDNYERTVKVPAFPSDIDEEEHCKLMLKDSDVDDVEYIVEKYANAKKPKAPKKPKQEKPTEPKKPNHEKARRMYEQNLVKAKERSFPKKPGKIAIGCGIVAIIILFNGGLFEGFLSFIINALILAVCAAGIAFDYYLKKTVEINANKDLEKKAKEGLARIEEEEKKYEQDMIAYQEALVASEQAYQEAVATYEKRMAAYQEAMAAYEQNKAAFLEEYTKWKELYLAHLEEEKKIAKQLEEDRIAGQEKRRKEVLAPAIALLKECNTLLTNNYLPHADTLIGFLKNGRADNLKEAINRYEEAKKLEEEAQDRCECCKYYDKCELAYNPPAICASYRPR